MNRVFILLAFAAVFPVSASAQIIITEIMYDLAEGSDSGREWIEVLNIGAAPIDLTAWRFFESNSHHKISGSRKLAPGEHAVVADDVAKFRVDWPEFIGLVFESAFSLNNDGESLEMRLGERASDSMTYDSSMGGDGSGESLQRVESSFMPGDPTPGEPIPESGLASAPSKETAQVISDVPIEVIGERRNAATAAVAAATVEGSWQWWLAPFALAVVGSGGLVLYRKHRDNEWEIEEIE